jgi:hypothetical protein
MLNTALNKRITTFLEKYATTYSKEQWLATFRDSNYAEYSTTAGPSSSNLTSNNDTQWIWSEDYQQYYYYDKKGECIWQSQQASTSSKGKK